MRRQKHEEPISPPASSAQTDTTEQTAEVVTWNFNEQQGQWMASGGTPPACPEPLLQSPIDLSKVTSVLYPGQYRGMHYKAHGGLALDNAKDVNVDIKMPIDGELTGLTRYLEAGEVQYLLDFTNPCGVAIRFDHLYTLSPTLQTIAEKRPQPTEDTRGLPLADVDRISLKAGELVATAIGHPPRNIAMDFGVYDLRSPNEISKNTTWANLHRDFSSQTFYGRCWLDLLPAADATKAKALPSRDQKSKKRSDYCTGNGTTLEINGGKPV